MKKREYKGDLSPKKAMSKDMAERYTWLVNYICKQEGKTSEVSRANVKEILGVIADIAWKWEDTTYDLYGLDLTDLFMELGCVRETATPAKPRKSPATPRKGGK